MDSIIKLSDAKVPSSFRSKRRKSKKLTQVRKSTNADAKISNRERKPKDENSKTQQVQKLSSSSKRRQKSQKAHFTEGRSEVQIELDKLNNQLR